MDELKVKAKNSDAVPGIAKRLETLDGIDEVRYIDEAVTRLAQLNDGLRWTSAFCHCHPQPDGHGGDYYHHSPDCAGPQT